MKYFTIRSGAVMPSIGLGTWKSDPGVVGEAVKSALGMGYRHLDCAFIYGNEAEIGSALKDVFTAGDVKRDDIFITSKLWNTEHAPADVEPALRQTLADLQLDCLDLYLIHWPVAMKKGSQGIDGSSILPPEEMPIIDTWRAMEKCVDKGLVKDIGVSNFSKQKLQDLLSKCRIKPAVNQIEMHPYLQMKELLAYCKEQGIFLTAYSPLGSNDRDPAFKRPDEIPILQDATVAKIATKHKATPAQILLAWHLFRNSAVIPKSVSATRQKENLEAASIELDEEDMSTLAALDKHLRYIDGSFWFGETSPYTLATLWDE